MTLMFDYSVPKEICEKITSAINGVQEFKIPDLKHEEHEFFKGDKYIFCVRGWGNLTGIGGHNLKPEKAAKIQDTLIEYIFKILTQ
jgi:hypothetical protein